jgi:hypothetical protein
MGTNTRIKKKKIPKLAVGEKIKVMWEFPNILEDGKYHISLTAHGGSGLPVYDWWNKAGELDVRKDERTGYKINPEISVDLTEIQ